MNQSENHVLERIELLVEKAAHHSLQGEGDISDLLLVEARDLAEVMDVSRDLFFVTYHRHVSDSFGVDFEILHGDPELMFGGV